MVVLESGLPDGKEAGRDRMLSACRPHSLPLPAPRRLDSLRLSSLVGSIRSFTPISLLTCPHGLGFSESRIKIEGRACRQDQNVGTSGVANFRAEQHAFGTSADSPWFTTQYSQCHDSIFAMP